MLQSAYLFFSNIPEALDQGNPETSTDNPSPEFSSQVYTNSKSSCITSKPHALSS